jgi:FAD/FMN-containing dehydrogenase
MAAKAGVSAATVQRVWAARGLKPHLVASFKLSNDPQFEEKLIDVVGLYLNPPEKAIDLRKLRCVACLGAGSGSRRMWSALVVVGDDVFGAGECGADQRVGFVVGAALRVPPDATAFSRREKCFNVTAMATWEDAAGDADHIAWARRTAAALQKRSASGGGYLNYGAPDEPIERVRAAYGDANFERLRQVKRRYDPHNLFRFNHNIPPAEA